ncbi:phage minor head protein [Aneurinibacillus thermoaerophilus]|uniref:phage head morphogenesis protein n=1 Tax=Aneurinibacillus thermoaerophilus TaxID=143495 RepID=UPI002E1D169B|nr:phage minor head protein [Aneurinibacillus thermoaerophilus]
MCRQCLERIIKADNDEFLESLDLTNAEREILEKLYEKSEEMIADILELQGQALHEAIQELSDELLVDETELYKVILAVQASDFFQEKFEKAVYDAFIPFFHLAGETELSSLVEGKRWSVENKAAARFALRLKKLVPDMNETSANIMLRSFQQAIKQGKTPSERANLVREISAQAAKGEEGPFSIQRAVTIARTMSTSAANGGKLEGWKQSEVVTSKKWRSANNSRTRPDHKAANGQIVPLDKPFIVGGEKLMHPGDPRGSAKQIVHCRCTMQAVIN